MSDDLISKKALFEEINSYHYDAVNLEIRRMEHIVKAHICELIDKQPTAYDMDKVVGKLETYISQQSENEMLSENGKWLVKRVIEECIKIVKSGGVTDK